MANGRQCHGPRTGKRGDLTGKDPTNRGKLGTKRHLHVDGHGIPLGVILSGANAHDSTRFRATMKVDVLRRPSAHRVEQHLCLDKAYDCNAIRVWARRRGFKAHIPHRGAPVEPRTPKKRARRWVVERTNHWHNLFRRLRIRYEVHARNYLGFVELANAIICFRCARP